MDKNYLIDPNGLNDMEAAITATRRMLSADRGEEAREVRMKLTRAAKAVRRARREPPVDLPQWHRVEQDETGLFCNLPDGYIESPDRCYRVLVCTRDGCVDVDEFDLSDDWITMANNDIDDIVAWAELPPAPLCGEEEK